MQDTTATLGSRTDRGDFLNEPISDRTSVRHALAEIFELGRAADGWDSGTHPFTNWGYPTRLDWVLANHDRLSAIKTGG